MTAFGLLATANVFSQLLQEGPTPERVVAALPALALVVGAFALRGLLDAAVATVAAAPTPRIEQRAQDALHAAMIEVELAAFDDADFTDLAQRAARYGIHRVHIATRATGGLLASVVSMLAAVVTAGLLHPLLAPVVLLAAVPQGWASIRAAKLDYDSFIRMTSRTRRLDVTGDLITERRYAADVRTLTAQDVLLAEHRRIATQLTVETIAGEHRKTLVQLAGRTLSGIGTALAYVVLALLLYTEVLPLALAGAAAVAMRTASSAVSVTVYEMNNLLEAGIFLDLYRTCVVDARSRRRAEPTSPLAGDPRLVELSGVTFHYPGQDRPAVDGVDLTLRRGEVVALVGENGSGKSTLAKLITGLYLPERGHVRWDGVDTVAVAVRELHARVGVVLQEPTSGR